MSTFSPNIQFEEVARNADVGTWDTPTNSNWTLADSALGATSVIPVNNSNIVLSAAQFQSKTLNFSSTLTGSITVTFATSYTKSYEIYNQATGSSAFTITLATTVAGSQAVCAPPGEIVDVANIGGNLVFKNLSRVGSYMDWAGSSVPAWISGCTVPPYLNCDGTTFSSGTFPALAVILGGTTLPDSKGRARFALDQSAGRISSAAGGFSGSGVGASGGQQTITLGTSNLPAYTPAGSVSGSVNQANLLITDGVVFPITSGGANPRPQSIVSNPPITGTLSGTPQGGVSAPVSDLPPAYIGGITMIRAA